ncbi:MAG: 2-C-methyl-D-erythritol 2,4-cyclodiphosphate synthase [bacterium]|nr:2-C-methyl-D-erythritol 2,4-cyclodiphosphate synthase [bacterium]
MRIGIGYDIHPLVEGRKLCLGGVTIPFSKGLQGHSDGDALTHAIIDALLGAIGEGDIGSQFGTESPKYKNISSLVMLEKVYEIIRKMSFQVNNVDSTVVAEKPKLASFINKMRENIAKILNIEIERVSIKSTTGKGIGVIGRCEGIASYAVVSVNRLVHSPRSTAHGK